MRRFLLGAVGSIVALFLVLTVVVQFIDLDRLKPQLERTASDALGMQVRIGGRLTLGLFRGLHVSVADGRILSAEGQTIASAERANFGADFFPLLAGRLRLNSIDLRHPQLTIARSAEGTLDAGRLTKAFGLIGALEGGKLRVVDGALHYVDHRSGSEIEASGFDLAVTHIRLGGRNGSHPLSGVSFHAEVACDSVRTKEFAITGAKVTAFGRDGVFDLRPISAHVFGGQLAAELHGDLTPAEPTFQLRCSLPKFRIEKFLSSQTTKKAVSGDMDFAANLTMSGTTKRALIGSAAGEMSLKGEDLTLEGSDLDRQLSRFESTQNFNLVDAGAVFFAGPLGLAVTKGYNFGSLFLGAGEKSTITRVVSEWKVEKGVAHAKDVAMATPKNRMALQGGLDFANERFADVTVAVIDEKGCAKGKQAIRGSFAKPEVEKPHLVKALTGSVVNELKRVRNVLPNGPCEPFYTGTVAAPR